MSEKKVKEYDVGYGKPPPSTRFKKGQSGNPSGRPKGSKNALSTLDAVVRKTVTVTVDGKTRRMSKFEAICLQLTNSALKGDQRSLKTLLDFMMRQDVRRMAEQVEKLEGMTQPINIVISPEDARL